MKYALITLIGLSLGFFMVLLIPAILGTYLTDWWMSVTGTPHVCAGGALPEADAGELDRHDTWAEQVIAEILSESHGSCD
jgi:hypothetical protein